VDLENAQRAAKLRSRIDELISEEDRLERDISSCRPAEPPENYAPPPRLLLAETVRSLSGELQALEALLRAPEKGLSSCPWCLSPLPDLTERRARLEEARPRYEALASCLAASEKYDRDAQTANVRRESLSRELSAVRSALGAMPDPVSAVTASNLSQVLRQAQAQLEALRRHKQELNVALAERDVQVRQEMEINRRISALTATLAERPSPSDEQAVMADRALKAAQSLWTSKVRLTGEKRACDSRVADLESRLQVAREEDARAEKALSARALASKGLELFHHSAVPADVVLDGLQEALEATNEVLVRFEQPFVVSCDDKMRFVARGVRGRHSAGRLSGAQRVLFGLAFRIGLLARFAPEAGLLVLDEPTAGLDEDNLGCLEVAFDALKQQAGGPLQVLMVTHEPSLTRLFDRAFCLKGPEGESGA
jgi:DNA repair exonuclease SbcCD ATPase subunit